MTKKVIDFSFYTLVLLTPLVWLPLNYELFEYNKMIVVYFLTTIIVGAWLLKMVNNKSIIINRSPLDIPILLFLAANILSTIFSIDSHTSIWGYYSRSNGGLLSIISYTLLYFAATSNLDKEKVIKLLKVSLLGGLIVALYAIPEHFGISPSCVMLRGDLTASCWIQDVQARVFATLGQPNWLASYLGMLILPALYFLLTSTTKKQKIIYGLLAITYYLAFTFTYSRGATLGLIVGLGVFITGYILCHPERVKRPKDLIRFFTMFRMTKILVAFLLVNILFGSVLTRFQLSDLLPKAADTLTNQQPTPGSVTQLEVGGTESGKIRLIVWQGALDIVKHYPFFGSGVETFAYAYYQFRPTAHNLVSEWDFLYNKAHNEFLNYLANTGIIGFGAYLAVILYFMFWCIRFIISKQANGQKILTTSILASLISYHISNFFGFSVVITALLFYLFPALVFISTDSTKPLKLPFTIPAKRVVQIILFIVICYLLLSILKTWYADTLFASGQKYSDSENIGSAYNFLSQATALNSNEPFYKSELGYVAASSAVATKEVDATISASLKDAAVSETERALSISPKNTSFWRTAIRTYYQLSSIDDSFTNKTLSTIDQTISLAPTDPKLYYNKAIILGTIDQNEQAVQALQKALELKPNYREGYFALALFYFDLNQVELAVETMNQVLKLVPGDLEALDQLNQWGKQGIATKSSDTK